MTSVEIDIQIEGPHTYLIEREFVNTEGVQVLAPVGAPPLTLVVRITPVDRCIDLVER